MVGLQETEGAPKSAPARVGSRFVLRDERYHTCIYSVTRTQSKSAVMYMSDSFWWVAAGLYFLLGMYLLWRNRRSEKEWSQRYRPRPIPLLEDITRDDRRATFLSSISPLTISAGTALGLLFEPRAEYVMASGLLAGILLLHFSSHLRRRASRRFNEFMGDLARKERSATPARPVG